MDSILKFTALYLTFVVVSCIENDFSHSMETVTTTLNSPFMKEVNLNSIRDTTNKFIKNVNDLLKETNEEKNYFIKNIEEDEISIYIRKIKTQKCKGENNYQEMKDYFLSRYIRLEFPVRAALTELENKVSEMKRHLILDKGIVDVKFLTCELLGMDDHCTNITLPREPCLSDACAPLEMDEWPGSPAPSKPPPSNRSSCALKASGKLATDCGNGQFQCQHSDDCIDLSLVCDGYYNCQDESDEMSSCKHDCPGKRCRNLMCIDESQICNGIDDCGDGTDEEICVQIGSTDTGTLENCNLKDENFLCSDKNLCLSVKSLCDGEPDCRDNSDEGANCSITNGCDRCSAMGGVCLRTPAGPLCLSSCPSGFVLYLESGVCVFSDSAEGLKILYKNYSLFGSLNKINILFRRLTNGFSLLKKYINNKILETSEKLSKCVHYSESLITLI